MKRAVIAGIGVASPATNISAEEGLRLAEAMTPREDRAWLASLYASCGVERRGAVVSPEEMTASVRTFGPRGATTSERLTRFKDGAGELAERAVREALEDAGLEPNRVTHIVTVSCTGAESPGLDHSLIARLPLSSSVTRTHLGFMGCHGALNGLAVAAAFVKADPDANVLVVCCELCSLHYQSGEVERDQLVANAIFGDGAACAVVRTDGSGVEIVSSSSRVFEGTDALMGWRIGDHGFEMKLSVRVPATIRRGVSLWMNDWLRPFGLDASGVDGWAIHPGGRDVVAAVSRGLGLEESATAASLGVLRERGNMSSGTVLWVLKELLAAGEGDSVVAVSFGPGLSAEAVLLRRYT